MEALLSFGAFFLFLYIYGRDVRIAKLEASFAKTAVGKATFSLFAIIMGSIILVTSSPPFLKPYLDVSVLLGSVLFSGLISALWIRYLRSIDIYEPERKIYLALTFFMACITIWFVFPLSRQINSLGFVLNGEPLNDFLYCVVGIGMVEELVKILPIYFLLRFTKQINEPIDYIVYGSVSALGFAFIENISYIYKSGLFNISGRMLYSSVAHMFDTSIISYGLGLDLIKNRKHRFDRILGWFTLASLAHGFYDFWLINEAFYLPFLTTLFLLGSLHIWVTLKNNLINFSNFYDKHIRIKRDSIKYELIVQLTFVIYLGAVMISWVHGSQQAISYIGRSLVNYMFLVVFLAFSLSSYNVVPGFLAKIKLPKWFILPKMKQYPNFEGKRIGIMYKNKGDRSFRRMYGTLEKRVVVEADFNWYLFESTHGFEQYLVRPLDFEPFEKRKRKEMKMVRSKRQMQLTTIEMEKKDLYQPRLVFAYLL